MSIFGEKSPSLYGIVLLGFTAVHGVVSRAMVIQPCLVLDIRKKEK
jgi:hypothetical protein